MQWLYVYYNNYFNSFVYGWRLVLDSGLIARDNF